MLHRRTFIRSSSRRKTWRRVPFSSRRWERRRWAGSFSRHTSWEWCGDSSSRDRWRYWARMMAVSRTAGTLLLALFLVACSDDDDEGGGDGSSDSSCGIGVTLSGDEEDTYGVNDSAGCAAPFSFESGIDAGIAPIGAGLSFQIAIAVVTEGQTGSGFPTEMGVTIDGGPSYSTSQTGCSATITEHALENTEVSTLGERDYRVVGSATCTEPALREDGMTGQILFSNITFHIPVVWSD